MAADRRAAELAVENRVVAVEDNSDIPAGCSDHLGWLGIPPDTLDRTCASPIGAAIVWPPYCRRMVSFTETAYMPPLQSGKQTHGLSLTLAGCPPPGK